MRLDLIRTKQYKPELTWNHSIPLFIGSLLLGLIPSGWYLILPCLYYFYLREDQTKYWVLAGYLLGSLRFGWQAGWLLGLVLGWNVFMQLACLGKQQKTGLVIVASILMCFFYGIYQKQPYDFIAGMLVLQYIGYQILAQEFFQDQAVLYYLGILITLLAIITVSKAALHEAAAITLIHAFLLYLIGILDERKSLFTILLSYIIFFKTILLPVTIVPLLLVLCMKRQAVWKRMILYAMIAIPILHIHWQHLLLAPNWFPFASQTMVIICYALLPTTFMWLVPKEQNHELEQVSDKYQQSSNLLLQFAHIFEGLAKLNPQMKALESIAKAFSYSEEQLRFHQKEQDLSAVIREALESYSFRVTKVQVQQFELLILKLQIANMHTSELDSMVLPILAKALGMDLHVVNYQKAGFFEGYHRIELASEKGLSMIYDAVQKAVDQECGDAMQAKVHGQYMTFMMSDGMGSGLLAREQSTLVLSLMERFIDANIGVKQAIKLVNQMALLQNEERYATLDVLCIDRFKKEALLYKSGSIQTYLLRDHEVYAFSSSSLPIGIVERINPEYYRMSLKKEDRILLVSDGADHEQLQAWIKESKQKSCSGMLRELYAKRLAQPIDDDISMMLICMESIS